VNLPTMARSTLRVCRQSHRNIFNFSQRPGDSLFGVIYDFRENYVGFILRRHGPGNLIFTLSLDEPEPLPDSASLTVDPRGSPNDAIGVKGGHACKSLIPQADAFVIDAHRRRDHWGPEAEGRLLVRDLTRNISKKKTDDTGITALVRRVPHSPIYSLRDDSEQFVRNLVASWFISVRESVNAGAVSDPHLLWIAQILAELPLANVPPPFSPQRSRQRILAWEALQDCLGDRPFCLDDVVALYPELQATMRS